MPAEARRILTRKQAGLRRAEALGIPDAGLTTTELLGDDGGRGAVLELLFFVGLVFAGLLLLGAILAIVGFTIRALFWVVLLPLKLLFAVLFLPLLILKLLIGVMVGIVVLPIAGIFGAIALVVGVIVFGALLIGPLLPFLLLGLIIWAVLKASKPAIA